MKKRMLLIVCCALLAGAAFVITPIQSAAAAGNDTLPPPPAGICSKCNPVGYHAFGPVHDFAGDPYSRNLGQCVWWPETQRLDEKFVGLGTYAYQWAANAPKHGFKTGTVPVVGSTVVFQRGVAGASSWAGHVAHVEVVYSGGWFLVSEMNFYAHGGGWDRVSYRYVHVGAGISFIY